MASVVISIDAELAWGFHDKRTIPDDRVGSGREAWVRLVELLDRFDMPATWAVVGHLFLEECDGRHVDHPLSPGWFDRDPGGSADPESTWFGPDLIDAIRSSGPDHEIASHSFSHVLFDETETVPETASFELARSLEIASAADLPLESFVFPRNIVGYRDLLAEHGFRSYRGQTPPRWFDQLPSQVRSVGKGLAFLNRNPPPIVTPRVDEHGLVNIPASVSLFSFEGRAGRVVREIASDPVVEQVRAGLDALQSSDSGVLHLWFHPNDLTARADWVRLHTVLTELDESRKQGPVRIEPMRAVARRVLEREDDLGTVET